MAKGKKFANDSEKRNTIAVNLDPETNQAVNRWLQRNHGWGKAEFVRTLVTWFAGAPDSIKHVVTGTVPGDMIEQYRERAAAYLNERIETAANPASPPATESETPADEPPPPVELGVKKAGREGARARAEGRAGFREGPAENQGGKERKDGPHPNHR